MAKKGTGFFNTDATRTLKKADRLYCKVAADDTILIGCGYFVYRMHRAEYAAIAQPATLCEPGDWMTDTQGNRTEGCTLDIEGIFDKAIAETKDAADLASCPIRLHNNNLETAFYYNAEKDFVAAYNPAYTSGLSGAALKATGATSPAVAYAGPIPVALVLPVRVKEDSARAAKAYFVEPDQSAVDDKSKRKIKEQQEMLDLYEKERRQAQDEIASLNKEIYRQAAEIDTLNNQDDHKNAVIETLTDEIKTLNDELARQAEEITALREQIAQQAEQATPAESKPEPKTAAELIAARFADMAGITTTIKGAHTAAPVVWLAGDTQNHAAEIEAAGARWSNKKSAWYFRVA